MTFEKRCQKSFLNEVESWRNPVFCDISIPSQSKRRAYGSLCYYITRRSGRLFFIGLSRSARYRRVYIKESQRVKLTGVLDPQTPIISKYTETRHRLPFMRKKE